MKHAGWMIALGISGAIALVTLLVAPYKVSDAASVNSPVLVELFTSEGCSSCPPADQLLARIQQADPNAVVLSEHVTYWNGIGWRDPFSSLDSTERQNNYVQHMGLSSSYTPQMVVNGRYEFVGSDAGAAAQALHQAAAGASVPLTISDLKTTHNHVAFSLQTGTVDKEAQLLVVLAQNAGIEHVASGENGGRTLRHVAIARTIRQVASVKDGSAYVGSVSLDVPQAIAGEGWHLVVFLQQGPGGPILGVASQVL
ncbi:MAG TPA: DUF1223 domain-containing protein [Edaphobacter sp.]|nr:DUF1223 domain-containing protein [Edaphobacter sp.]